jgi:hypothetical protein
MMMIGSGSGRGSERLLTDCSLRTLEAHVMHTNASFGMKNSSTPFPMIFHVADWFSGFIFESS